MSQRHSVTVRFALGLFKAGRDGDWEAKDSHFVVSEVDDGVFLLTVALNPVNPTPRYKNYVVSISTGLGGMYIKKVSIFHRDGGDPFLEYVPAFSDSLDLRKLRDAAEEALAKAYALFTARRFVSPMPFQGKIEYLKPTS